MNFDLSDEQEMIVDAVQKFVSNDSPVERFRKLHVHDIGWEKSLWSAMGEYGWLGVAVLIGGQLGSRLGTQVLSARTVKRLTATLVLYVAGRLLYMSFA